jgi:competence protein ComEC
VTVLQVVVTALGVYGAAWWSAPIPGVVAGFGVLTCLGAGSWWRRWYLVAIGLSLAACALGALAEPSVPAPQRVTATAVLRSDPVRFGRGASATIVLGSHHVRVVAWGAAAGRLSRISGGHRVCVTGWLRPLAPERRRGAIASELTIESVCDLGDQHLLARSANRVRGVLASGANQVPDDVRGLYLGIGYGDDRSLPLETVADMRVAGLSHLTAVSGQNIAVILGLVQPVMARWSPRRRAGLVLSAAMWLCVITRSESSVLRASAMAVVVAGASAWARPIEPMRALSCAVIVTVLLDPLIVRAPGYQLSVAATAGVVGLGPLLARARALGSERGWRGALAVTLSAQLATWPLLARFGAELALSSIPANLVAVPLAGAVMIWAWTVGVVAALVPALQPVAGVVVTVALRLIVRIGHAAADHPLVVVRWWMVGAVALAWCGARCRPQRVRQYHGDGSSV